MNEPGRARFRLDIQDERLWDGETPVRLTRKAFELLRFFVQNPNRLLTKQQILENVWRDVHVSEGLVKEYVSDLRLALDDDPRRPRLIETVRGRGYRLLGGIVADDPATRPFAGPGSGIGPPSVAVLPPENLAEGERWARFCRGMADDLITDLSRFPDLLVTAKSASSADWGDQADIQRIGREIGADYVLGGSMQASKNCIRVNFHLVETSSGHHVWAERYERAIGDLFAVQTEVVALVVNAVGGYQGQISNAERLRIGRRPPSDLHAYELFLLGLHLEERHERQSVLRAFELLNEAVERDPELGRAWLVLGWACFQIASEGWSENAKAYSCRERQAHLKAAFMDPRDPDALSERAAIRARDGDLIGALDELELALDLSTNRADQLAGISKYVAMIMDDPERAMQVMDRSLELNPRPPDWYFMHDIRVAYFAGEFERALRSARRGPDLRTVRLFEVLSLAQLGLAEEVQELLSRFRRRYPRFEPEEFMKTPHLCGAHARSLFLDGIAKAGLR